MPAPSLETLCVDIEIDASITANGGLVVIFPGDVEMKVTLPNVDIMGAGDLAKQLMGTINAALMPLAPLFNILDVVLLIFKILKAIPDMVGPPPNPGKVIKLIASLEPKIDKLLSLIPVLSVPILIKGLLLVLIVFLQGIRAQLQAVIALNAEIAAAEARATALAVSLPNVSAQLSLSVGCAQATASATIQGMGMGAEPFNKLVGVVNLFMGLAGLPEVPTITDLGTDAEAALAPIDASIALLTDIRALIVI